MAFLTDGHATYWTFSQSPSVHLKEISVTPPSIEGGGENDTTTMRNSTWRTRQPKKLKTLGPSSFTAQYDPDVYEDLVSMINVNQKITITFSDGSTVEFWGWLDNFTPGETTEGEMPNATCTIIPSNQDNSGTEVAPVYTPPSS